MFIGRVGLAAIALSTVVTAAACSSAGHTPTTATPTTPTTATPATAAAQPVVATASSSTPPASTSEPTPASTSEPTPAPNPCGTNTAVQLVKVSVRQQHLWMCAGHKLVRDTAVTTGIPGEDTHTPTGTYTIQARTRNTTLTLISGQTYAVKYWIPFDGPLFGFHDSSWQDFAYGSAKYKTQGSHGCVHMPVKAIAFLYRWAHVGATVRIH